MNTPKTQALTPPTISAAPATGHAPMPARSVSHHRGMALARRSDCYTSGKRYTRDWGTQRFSMA